MSWLHDEQGNVRRELYTQSPNEIAAKAAELDARPTSYQGHPRVGLQVHVKPKYSIVSGCDGWMNVVRFDRSAINGPSVLSERPDGGGGGFISLEMIDGLRVGNDLAVPGRMDFAPPLFLAAALKSAPPTIDHPFTREELENEAAALSDEAAQGYGHYDLPAKMLRAYAALLKPAAPAADAAQAVGSKCVDVDG